MLTNSQFSLVMKLVGKDICDKLEEKVVEEAEELDRVLNTVSDNSFVFDILSEKRNELENLQKKLDYVFSDGRHKARSDDFDGVSMFKEKKGKAIHRR